VAATSSSSSPTPAASVSAVNTANSKSKNEIKKLFKQLSRSYMSKRRIPSDKEMQGLWAEKASITFEDIIHWKDEIGLKRGVLFDEDGTVLFDEWPIRPLDAISDEFNLQFSNQLRHPYVT
jgi:hypothetical protein